MSALFNAVVLATGYCSRLMFTHQRVDSGDRSGVKADFCWKLRKGISAPTVR